MEITFVSVHRSDLYIPLYGCTISLWIFRLCTIIFQCYNVNYLPFQLPFKHHLQQKRKKDSSAYKTYQTYPALSLSLAQSQLSTFPGCLSPIPFSSQCVCLYSSASAMYLCQNNQNKFCTA